MLNWLGQMALCVIAGSVIMLIVAVVLDDLWDD